MPLLRNLRIAVGHHDLQPALPSPACQTAAVHCAQPRSGKRAARLRSITWEMPLCGSRSCHDHSVRSASGADLDCFIFERVAEQRLHLRGALAGGAKLDQVVEPRTRMSS